MRRKDQDCSPVSVQFCGPKQSLRLDLEALNGLKLSLNQIDLPINLGKFGLKLSLNQTEIANLF